MNHGSLFSGIGGFDLAAEWMGWENVFHCEWNDFGKRILKYYWPNSISYDDITKTDFSIHRGTIDILTGGFPCQPYSTAGKRRGKEDERHLWPEMLRAIREIQPTWIVGENVRGLTNWNGGMVFDEVQSDLENIGYEVTPFLLPACAVNAPHRRDRIWFVAFKNSYKNGWGSDEWQKESGIREQRNTCSRNNERISTDNGETRPVAYSNGSKQRNYDRTDGEKTEKIRRKNKGDVLAKLRGDGMVAYPYRIRQSGEKHRKKESRQFAEKSIPDNWENFPTQHPICDGNDGISTGLDGITFPEWRNESIKAGGNAIVPQVALQIFKAIEQYNKLEPGI